MTFEEMKKYEVALVNKDGTIVRGGIPTSKAHAQRWANENAAMYPDERFIAVEYKAETV